MTVSKKPERKSEESTRKFGLQNKTKEGLEAMEPNKWYRVWLQNRIQFYLNIEKHCNDGIEAKMTVHMHSNGMIKESKGFITYGSIETYVSVPEEEIKATVSCVIASKE